MRWGDVAGELDDYLHKGDLDHCIEHVSQIIAAMPQTPFHLVLTSEFTNAPQQVAFHFDTFFAEMREFAPGAIYTETNGFFINPDRWYFELFGYRAYGGREDYDWLANWDAMSQESITLIGMESLQQVYKQYKILPDDADPVLRQVNDLSDLLVVYKFQNLIKQSVPLMQKVRCPLMATSHEFDIIAEFTPS